MSEQDALNHVSKIVSRETMVCFVQIEQALVQWSRRFNLVSPASLSQFWSRHVLDSVQLFDLAPNTAKTWLDMGSGAGFPGMILAIMLRERLGATMVLVESNRKKASFLQHCTRISGAPATIKQQRIETVIAENIDVITARALAPLDQLLAFSQPFCGKETLLILPKGKNAKQELTNAQKQWDIEVDMHTSKTDCHAVVLCVRKFSCV